MILPNMTRLRSPPERILIFFSPSSPAEHHGPQIPRTLTLGNVLSALWISSMMVLFIFRRSYWFDRNGQFLLRVHNDLTLCVSTPGGY